MADSHGTLSKVLGQLGLDAADSLRQPSWNGKTLEQVYPWGTIRTATPEANKATAAELSAEQIAEIRLRTWQYLDVFGYEKFI
jgi:hypothetical protein